jgi:hypothetical protein
VAQVLAGDPDLAASGSCSRVSSFMKVDLPDPDGPTTKTNSPLATSSGDVVERDDLVVSPACRSW